MNLGLLKLLKSFEVLLEKILYRQYAQYISKFIQTMFIFVWFCPNKKYFQDNNKRVLWLPFIMHDSWFANNILIQSMKFLPRPYSLRIAMRTLYFMESNPFSIFIKYALNLTRLHTSIISKMRRALPPINLTFTQAFCARTK